MFVPLIHVNLFVFVAGYQYAQSTWTVGDSAMLLIGFLGSTVSTYVCVCLSLGGSLDTYGSIPEPVLGRVAIAVGHCFEVFVCVCVVARCVVLFANAGSEGLKLLVEFEDHAQRLLLSPFSIHSFLLSSSSFALFLSSSLLLALAHSCVHD